LTSIFFPAPVFPKLLNRNVAANKSENRTQVIANCVSQKAYKEGDDLPSQVLKVDGSSEDPPYCTCFQACVRAMHVLLVLYIIIIIIIVVVIIIIIFVVNLWGANPT
jgi:hypothetical protein